MIYLLDTNICIYIINNKPQQFLSALSNIISASLRFRVSRHLSWLLGVEKSGSDAETGVKQVFVTFRDSSL